ncbi:small RNA 2'-O-methyltransferase [Salarias fasciatus]|uniref:small RNA 2'-O-methyltransferase n=1 Tax=Salarias fasciatus TaxID=181472 RepID=UPI001176799F|nr:small RNA 2'-O-methyltransferase [Salarias fasciatus]
MLPTKRKIFTPSLQDQRHQFVFDHVRQNKPRKVADLGCSGGSLLRRLRFLPDISLLVGVDVQGELLTSMKYELRPLPSDYLQPRVNQLRVELFQGSVTQKDSRLRGFDLVTSIELIEHLTLDDVERFSSSLFGYMSPQVAIVSTPNSEYNPLLPGLAGFRHKDHKFEWTRAEFRSWALKVCCDYGYEVEFTGVGRAPPGQQDQVGFCSQIAVFRRLREGDRCNVWPGNDAEDLPYTKVASIIYPSLRDSNHLRGFLLCELFSCAKTLMTGSFVSVPLKILWSWSPKISELCESLSHLRNLLMDQPKVTLSQDGSAVIVKLENQGQDEDEDADN